MSQHGVLYLKDELLANRVCGFVGVHKVCCSPLPFTRGPHKLLKPGGDTPGEVDIPVPDFLPEDVASQLKQLDEQLEQGMEYYN